MSNAVDELAAHTDPLRESKLLVRRMLAGDERARDQFADRYFSRLYRFALSRLDGDADLAREIVQTAVCKALAKLESYRGEAPLFGWLCACCRNEILMHFRHKRSLPQVIELALDASDGAVVPDSTDFGAPQINLERKEAARLVHESLDQLPPHYAQALEWKYIEHLPVVEIANRLSLRPKAAESVLTRARAAFRKSYERLTHCPQSLAVAAVGSGEMTR